MKGIKMKMYKIYLPALILYAIPPISLVLFIIAGSIENMYDTIMIFFGLFLLSLLPCGLIGIILSSIGLIKSRKNKNNFNKDMGTSGIVVGLIFIFGGILALGLIYVVTS